MSNLTSYETQDIINDKYQIQLYTNEYEFNLFVYERRNFLLPFLKIKYWHPILEIRGIGDKFEKNLKKCNQYLDLIKKNYDIKT